MCLHVLNKQANELMVNKQMIDRSPHGNCSSFRNEKVNGGAFDWWPQWNLPETGLFECDFVYFVNRPNPAEETPEQEFEKLCLWFKNKYEEMGGEGTENADENLGNVFRAVSDYFTFSS